MPPPRRRGGNRAKDIGKLSLGDLVLAKVKGYPYWPAKVSKAEDWKKPSDPKKYFVEFFGTSEIAFVAPSDIQVFTNETKSKLYARCQGKKDKCFARAVEEICAAFNKLYKKSMGEFMEDNGRAEVDVTSSTTDNADDSKHGDHHETHEDQEAIIPQKRKVTNNSFADELSALQCCSQARDGKDSKDVKQRTAEPLALSIMARNKPLDPCSRQLQDEAIQLSQAAYGTSSIKEVNSLTSYGDVAPNSSKSFPVSGRHKFSEAAVANGGSGGNEHESSLGTAHLAVDLHEAIENGLDTKNLVSKSERKPVNSLKGQKRQGVTKHVRNSSSDKVDESKEKLENEFNYKSVAVTGKRESLSSDADTSDSHARERKHATYSRRHFRKDKLSVGRRHSKMRSESPGLDEEGAISTRDHGGEKTQTKKRKELDSQASVQSRNAKLEISVDVKTKKSNQDSWSQVENADATRTENLESKRSALSLKDNKRKTDFYIISDNIKHTSSIKSGKHSSAQIIKSEKYHHAALSQIDTKSVQGRCDKVRKTMMNSSINSEATTNSSSDVHTKEEPSVVPVHSSIVQSRARRTFRLADDEEEKEAHKTPVHRKSTDIFSNAISDVSVSVSETSILPVPEHQNDSQPKTYSVERLKLERHVNKSFDDHMAPAQNNFLAFLGKVEHKLEKANVQISSSSIMPELRSSTKEVKPTSISPKTSNDIKLADHKTSKPQGKTFDVNSSKKTPASTSKFAGDAPGKMECSQDVTPSWKANALPAKLKPKGTLKSSIWTNMISENRASINFSAEQNLEISSFQEEGFDTHNERAASLSFESKFSDPVNSMKHLIAVAQAKRKQAHSHYPDDVAGSCFISNNFVSEGSNPNPVAPMFPFKSEISTQNAPSGFYSSATLASPSTPHHGLPNQVEHGEDNHRASPVFRPPGGSLSGGTEAAVVRDALEGMIETLSRTKDSIGRATRLAIECAKYGIANEVVELLIRKLENEPSFHRRVDLFFLVDSITQCSHSQKGIASASYVPTVQAALPRLLSVAAPPGSGARENRRQCVKVLKIWIDRKIMPESALRRYIDDIEVPNDAISSVAFSRRPSRAERSIDDPIREMEGFLVDEYGSNATFPLPILLSSKMFDDDDDEDLPNLLPKINDNDLPVEERSNSEGLDICVVTPNDKHHHILEDVDGELEMEDVSLHSKNERGMLRNSSVEFPPLQQNVEEIPQSNMTELSTSLNGSPPLPSDSPPPPPPLPSSPPPPPPPPPPSSPPPPPPPPPFPPPPIAVPSSASSAYPSFTPQEYGALSGNQPVEMTANAARVQNNPTLNEQVVRQPPNFAQNGPCIVQPLPGCFASSRPFDYAHNDMHVNPQASHPNHQFQSGSAAYPQMPYSTLPPVQTPTNPPLPTGQAPLNHHFSVSQSGSDHFTFPNHLAPQHVHQSHHSYSMASHHIGNRLAGSDAQWRLHSSDFIPDNQQGQWAGTGRMTPSSRAIFSKDGFLRPNMDGSCSGSSGFQQQVHNSMSSGVSAPGNGGHPALPGRPDAPLNSWRPS